MRFLQAANGLRYRRLGRTRLGNGNPPKFRKMPKKRADSQPSSARCVGRLLSVQAFLRLVFDQTITVANPLELYRVVMICPGSGLTSSCKVLGCDTLVWQSLHDLCHRGCIVALCRTTSLIL